MDPPLAKNPALINAFKKLKEDRQAADGAQNGPPVRIQEGLEEAHGAQEVSSWIQVACAIDRFAGIIYTILTLLNFILYLFPLLGKFQGSRIQWFSAENPHSFRRRGRGTPRIKKVYETLRK